MRLPPRTKIIPPKPADIKQAAVDAVLRGKKSAPIWRDMTDAEDRMVQALATVRFPIASFDKRFARDVGIDDKITAKQAAYLRIMVIRYRRQIKPEVVELAKASVGVNLSIP